MGVQFYVLYSISCFNENLLGVGWAMKTVENYIFIKLLICIILKVFQIPGYLFVLSLLVSCFQSKMGMSLSVWGFP